MKKYDFKPQQPIHIQIFQKKTRMPDFADSPARPAFGRRASQGDEGGPGRGRRGAYSLLERTVVLPIRHRQRPIDPSSGTLPGCKGERDVAGIWRKANYVRPIRFALTQGGRRRGGWGKIWGIKPKCVNSLYTVVEGMIIPLVYILKNMRKDKHSNDLICQ